MWVLTQQRARKVAGTGTSWRHAALPVLFGLSMGAPFMTSPWSILTPVALGWLFWQASKVDARSAFRTAFLFALGFFAVHLAWLPVSFAALFGPLGALVIVPLTLLLALMWGATVGLTRHLAGCYSMWAFPFAWVLQEYLRSLGPFAFTWGTLGYAFSPTPLIQIADLGGIHLVSLLVALAGSTLASWRQPRVAYPVMLTLFAGTFAYGSPDHPELKVRYRALLVQGAVDPRAKASGREWSEFELYARLTRGGLNAHPVDVVLWPETASPVTPTNARAQRALRGLNVPVLLGAPTSNTSGSFNSAYSVSGDQQIGRQDKVKLVPFGEFLPFRALFTPAYDAIFTALGLPALQGVQPGVKMTPLALGPLRVALSICYESTFPALARQLVRDGANVLVTISNDAWFGRTVGAEQHFQMGRVRAIETRRPWLRVGNDGVSAVVNERGEVTARFPRGERAAFPAAFGVSDALTPYVRFGDWPVGLSVLALMFIFLRRQHESRRF